MTKPKTRLTLLPTGHDRTETLSADDLLASLRRRGWTILPHPMSASGDTPCGPLGVYPVPDKAVEWSPNNGL